jgi:hypothetical protein
MTADNSCAESGKSVTRGQQNLEVFTVDTWGMFTVDTWGMSTVDTWEMFTVDTTWGNVHC